MGESMNTSNGNVDMLATGLILALSRDENDKRTFLACEGCRNAFLVFDSDAMTNKITSMTETLSILPRIIVALRHVAECPYDQSTEGGNSV